MAVQIRRFSHSIGTMRPQIGMKIATGIVPGDFTITNFHSIYNGVIQITPVGSAIGDASRWVYDYDTYINESDANSFWGFPAVQDSVEFGSYARRQFAYGRAFSPAFNRGFG